MRRNRILQRFLSSLIALMMILSILLPGSVFAENRQPDSEKAAENGEKILLTGIIITGLEAPAIGKPLPDHADVESAEGVRWEIPVFWMDEDGNELSGTAETEDCFPVLAFFLPPEYTMAEDDTIAMSDAVLALFRGKTFYTVYDARTGVIYILVSGARPGLLVVDAEQEEPQEIIPAPEEMLIPEDDEETAPTEETESEKEAEKEQEPGEEQKPGEEQEPGKEQEPGEEQEPGKESGTDENPEQPETAEPEQEGEAEPLRVDLVPVHCSKTAQDSLSQEDLARLVDLIRNKIQPQTINYLIDRIPAFREAYDREGIGRNLGFYIYSGSADPGDKTPGHAGLPNAYAYISGGHSYDPETKEYIYAYILAFNAGLFFEKDENGVYKIDPETGLHILTTDDETLQDLENTIVHEMLHVLMHDYNRVGMSGYVKEDMWGDPSLSNEEKWTMYRDTMFPVWFKEGLACSVQNAYQQRFLHFSFFSYDGNGGLEDEYTPETVRKAYKTTFFKTDPNSRLGYNLVLDLEAGEDPNVKINKNGAQYATGYLAILYLAELAANQRGETSIGVDENGRAVLDSDPLRIGISTILSRLHNGETLDELIANLSNGAFENTADFQARFIKGDDDSLDFCVDYLNYMRDLTKQPDRRYLPNGSVMLDFDLDYMSPFDRNVNGVKNAMVIVDSNKREKSTVENVIAYVGGGKVTRGDYTELDDDDMDDESTSEEEEADDDVADPGLDTDGESKQGKTNDVSQDDSGSGNSGSDESGSDESGSDDSSSDDDGWDDSDSEDSDSDDKGSDDSDSDDSGSGDKGSDDKGSDSKDSDSKDSSDRGSDDSGWDDSGWDDSGWDDSGWDDAGWDDDSEWE